MYNHCEIEKKWQNFWDENKTYKIENDFSKPKYYCLDMFPYPSGAGLHVGHPEGYTANDIVARYKNACGYNVLHPMGWDAFGLPAENYAIKTGTHPRATTDQNIKNFRKQIKSLGFSYDWDREIDTTDPNYYKWTQWIFLKLFEQGLAYEQDLPINYCPSCKTGLANEEVLNDFSCDRCGTKVEKKKIKQWVLAITKYADRLLKDVDKLDWPEGIKDMQRNWIGKSEGCEFEMKKYGDETKTISVYTTRVDTVFGMTYAVLAPDHKDINNFITDEYRQKCEDYINNTSSKSDQDRTALDKEKTGVFTGSYVINPFSNKKVPLWIADYVLGNYGTGAVMAVPAHDTRDFTFAKKYDLEIIQSIAPFFYDNNGKDAVRKDKKTIKRNNVIGVLIDNKNQKVFVLDWEKYGWKSFIIGGVEDNEKNEEAVLREIKEESGYQNLKIIRKLGGEVQSNFFAHHKDINRYAINNTYLVELLDDYYIKPNENEIVHHKGFWIDIEKAQDYLNLDNHKYVCDIFLNGEKAFTDYGILINSGEFDGLTSQEAKVKLTEYSQEKGIGEKKVNYKLRDWLFSRQRYWGEPIPLIHISIDDYEKLPKIKNMSDEMKENKAYIFDKRGTNKRCKNCDCNGEGCVKLIVNKKAISKVYDGLYTKIIGDYNLPLKLPEVEEYEPAGDGNSPLTKVEDFLNVKIANNLVGKRETNTMPQWGGSCWYYLRFMDPKNENELVSKEAVNYWGEVDSYVGGAEHAVLHLLYARFWHKFLFDIGIVPSDEPFYRLRNQGLILSYAFQRKNGGLVANDEVEQKSGKFFEKETGEELNQIVSKMSKSLKNVVNPDDIISEYGADSLRLYEMYIADFKDSAPWDTKNILGVRRFLDRVYSIYSGELEKYSNDDELAMKTLHKTIKKVGEDIVAYKFNTAIAQMMICINEGLPRDLNLQKKWKEYFLKILHPFAPHLAEELWSLPRPVSLSETGLGKRQSIFFASWPEYDENLVKDDTIKIGVQILGKLRGEIEIGVNEDKDSVFKKVYSDESIKRWIDGKDVIKEIYVPGRIVNIVIK